MELSGTMEWNVRKVNKYHAKKTERDGILFDSRKEADRYAELVLMKRAGIIHGLELQKKFELIPKQKDERSVVYRADFTYIRDGVVTVEDVKGVRTKDYILKRKLFKFLYPNIRFVEV